MRVGEAVSISKVCDLSGFAVPILSFAAARAIPTSVDVR